MMFICTFRSFVTLSAYSSDFLLTLRGTKLYTSLFSVHRYYKHTYTPRHVLAQTVLVRIFYWRRRRRPLVRPRALCLCVIVCTSVTCDARTLSLANAARAAAVNQTAVHRERPRTSATAATVSLLFFLSILLFRFLYLSGCREFQLYYIEYTLFIYIDIVDHCFRHCTQSKQHTAVAQKFMYFVYSKHLTSVVENVLENSISQFSKSPAARFYIYPAPTYAHTLDIALCLLACSLTERRRRTARSLALSGAQTDRPFAGWRRGG